MTHPLDEKDVKHKYVVRLQTLSRAWADKWAGANHHSQQLKKFWISGYYDKSYGRYHLVNLINRAVTTGVSYLAEGNPRVLIEPISPKLQTFAYAMKLVTNFLLEKNNFSENVLIPGAIASYFGAAISRTFYEYNRTVSLGGERIKLGKPVVRIIDPVDYIGDPSAKSRADFAFEGDQYRLPTKYAKDLFARKDKFGNQLADYIEADAKLNTKYSTGDLLKNGYDPNMLALEDYTTFIDIFNHKEKTIETIMPMGKKAIVLKTIKWKGPGSPYDYLGYRYPPGIPVPIPPAFDVYDLDVTMNIIAQKERQRAESQKTVIAAEPTGEKAAKAAVTARHMDVVKVKGMDSVKEFQFGGPTAEGLGWMQWANQEFQKAGATTSDVVGGKGPSSDTLGQDQMIYANASRVVNGYYTRFHNWMESILRKWVFAIMEDPTTYVEVLDTVQVPGLGKYEYPVYFSKADKAADFAQLVLKVVPYSTQRMTPEMRYQRMFQYLTSWIMPTMQLRREQGSDIDLAKVDRTLADYGGMDNFDNWYRTIEPSGKPDVDYLMTNKNPGQMNDSLGATGPSKAANSQGFDQRQGTGVDRTTGQEKQE